MLKLFLTKRVMILSMKFGYFVDHDCRWYVYVRYLENYWFVYRMIVSYLMLRRLDNASDVT